MATNPKTVPIANKVDDAQLQTLASGGSITKGGDTYTADERAVYLLPDDRVVVGAVAPTTSTVGFVGQFYLVPTSGSEALYICTAEGDTYTWKQITLT